MTATMRAREIVADALGLEIEAVTEAASIGSLPDWDSLQHLAVVAEIEARLSVSLSPEQVTELVSVVAIASLIEARR